MNPIQFFRDLREARKKREDEREGAIAKAVAPLKASITVHLVDGLKFEMEITSEGWAWDGFDNVREVLVSSHSARWRDVRATCERISTKGFFPPDGPPGTFIPPHRVRHIEVEYQT